MTLALVVAASLVTAYVERFNATDVEHCTNAIPNSAAAEFLEANVPRFSCPDKDIERAYYFRWWTYRKHLRRDTNGVWTVSEFLPNVLWSGYGNTISCPLVHHLREGRWLRDPKYMASFLETVVRRGRINGPRAYACAPARGALDVAKVTGDYALADRLLGDFVKNYETWERGWKIGGLSCRDVPNTRACKTKPMQAGFRPERGLFDFAGDREGSEFALSVEGARPMVNSMMWTEAAAIAEIARRRGDAALADRFAAKAEALRSRIVDRLWNRERKFFTTWGVDGLVDDVCELNGYAPFYFSMPLPEEFDRAFDALTDPKGFLAPVGLTFPRRDTPGFEVGSSTEKHACLWNGPSWPYSTSIALTALANRLQAGAKLAPEDFVFLLRQYALQHRRVREDGSVVPWIDENLDPFTGDWLARTVLKKCADAGEKNVFYERGKDYNHSTFCDLVISGLAGIVPDGKGDFAVKPLFPREWEYLTLENLRVAGHEVSVRYRRGEGLTVTVDGRTRVGGDDAD